jgi:putative ABC transport system permease protein
MQQLLRSLNIALKHWPKDFSYAEMRLLLLATLIAAMSMSMITTFTDRLTRTMEHRASELIAADIVLRSRYPVSEALISGAKQFGIQHASATIFPTMVFANDTLEMTRVRAVSAEYPLKGSNQLSSESFGTSTFLAAAPTPGNVWVEQRVLQALNIAVGDNIELGDALFKVEYILEQDADRSGNFYSPFGRLIMNQADLDKANVLGLGSRILHKHYFAASNSATENDSQANSSTKTVSDSEQKAQIEAFADWLQPQLNEHEKISGAVNSDSSVGSAVLKAQQYLGLASLIAVLLAGIAIAIASQRYSERHFETVALMRCLGAQQKTITQIFIFKLCCTGLIAAVVGGVLGYLGHLGLLWLMKELIPDNLAAASLTPMLLSGFSSLVVLLAFALAPLLQLRQVSPVRVLRRELTPPGLGLNFFYLFAVCALAFLAFILTNNLKLTVTFVMGMTILTLLYAALASFTLRAFERLLQNKQVSSASKSSKYKSLVSGFHQLYRHRFYAVTQLGAFAFIFTAITLISIVRSDLFTQWQASVPEDTPNHFAINVLPDVKDNFEQFLKDKDIESSDFYPIVRGRLIEINQQTVNEIVSKEDDVEAVRRELSLTWQEELDPDSKLVTGEWWDTQNTLPDTREEALVSVESRLADKLGIELNDQLTFTVAGQPFTARVTSLREVKWDNFKPNFYMIFKPGTLNHLHHTYINSFYLAEQNSELLVELNRQFKAVTLIPAERIIQQVREILQQTTLAIEYILLLVLGAGITLLYATLLSTLPLRRQETAIYRTLGASRKYLKHQMLIEYGWLGMLAGLFAMASCELISYALYQKVFEAQWQPHPELWLIVPAIAAAIIMASGWFASRSVLDASPSQLLKEN